MALQVAACDFESFFCVFKYDNRSFRTNDLDRKPKMMKTTKKELEQEISVLKSQMEIQLQSQMQTQAMLDHMLVTDCKEPKGVKLPSKNSAKKRPPKRSPNHKRIRINEDLQRAEKMQVEPQVENDVKAKLDPFDPKSVEAFVKQWRPTLREKRFSIGTAGAYEKGEENQAGNRKVKINLMMKEVKITDENNKVFFLTCI